MKTTYILKLSNKRYLNHLLRYQIKFNKIEYQNDILSILEPIDKKIKLNEEVNDNLAA